MGQVSSLGQMGESMMEITMMTRSKEGVCSLGLMEGGMMDNGTMENNMVKESIILLKERSDEVNGEKARESNGFQRKLKRVETVNELLSFLLCNAYDMIFLIC